MSRVLIFGLAVSVFMTLAACGSSSPATTPAPLNGTAAPAPAELPPATAATAAPTLAASTPSAPQTPLTSTLPITDTEQFFNQILNAPHDTIKSSDGSASLLIPNGALPPGKAASDITITKIDPAQLQVTVNGKIPLVAYQMEPQGLQFTQDVVFSSTLDIPADGLVPAPFTLAGDQIGTPLAVAAIVDAGSGKVTLLQAIDVTSGDIHIPGSVRVKMPQYVEALVNETFQLQTVVSLAPGVNPINGWDLGPYRWEVHDPILSPVLIMNPGFKGLRSQSYSEAPNFTCKQQGNTLITFAGTAKFAENLNVVLRGNPAVIYSEEFYEPIEFSSILCKTPTPTATVWVTPTAPPHPTGSQVRGAAPPAIGIDLTSGGSPVGSGVFISQDNQTEARVDVKPNGNNSPQLASIRQGTCQRAGAVLYPLSNVVNGSSRTVIDAGLASLLRGNLVVNIEQSANRPAACGAIPNGAVITLGPGRDGDQSPAYAVLLAAGNQTQVTLNVSLTESTAEQPVAIYAGSCANPGAAKYHPSNAKFGVARMTVNASLQNLLGGGFVIALSKSTSEPGTFVACGDLK